MLAPSCICCPRLTASRRGAQSRRTFCGPDRVPILTASCLCCPRPAASKKLPQGVLVEPRSLVLRVREDGVDALPAGHRGDSVDAPAPRKEVEGPRGELGCLDPRLDVPLGIFPAPHLADLRPAVPDVLEVAARPRRRLQDQVHGEVRAVKMPSQGVVEVAVKDVVVHSADGVCGVVQLRQIKHHLQEGPQMVPAVDLQQPRACHQIIHGHL
eukprot:UN3252